VWLLCGLILWLFVFVVLFVFGGVGVGDGLVELFDELCCEVF